MEIIYHTADIDKDIKSLEKVLNSGLETVELDFVMTKDAIPVWTHDLYPTQILKYSSPKLKGTLTLYDILEINNHRCKLMLDIKYVPQSILNSRNFIKLLNTLNQYDEMQIQSLDLNFLNRLIEGNYSNIEKGLIVNVITRSLINVFKVSKIKELDFLALSSELWERNDGKFLEQCVNLYPNIKKYGWTWARRIETEETIQNFINKNADGIMTENPEFVKSMIKKIKSN